MTGATVLQQDDPRFVEVLKEVGAHGKVYRVTGASGESPFASKIVARGDRESREAEVVRLDLPRNGKPGAWAEPRPIERGYYLTPHPQHYVAFGMRVFEAEVDHTRGVRVLVRRIPEGLPMVEVQVERFRLVRERPDLVYPNWRAIERLLVKLADQRSWMSRHRDPLRRWIVMDDYRHALRVYGAVANSHIPMLSRMGAMERAVEVRQHRLAAAMMRYHTETLIDDFVIRVARRTNAFNSGVVVAALTRDVRLAVFLRAVWGMPLPADMADELHAMKREIEARLEVWQRGYGCYGMTQDGAMVVYKRP